MPTSDAVLCRPFRAVLLMLGLGVPTGCGSEPGSGATDRGQAAPRAEIDRPRAADTSADDESEDWVARQRRVRQPELTARMEASARAVEARPEDGGARSEHGWALLQAGKIDRAIAELQRAVALSGDEFVPHQRLGMALLRDGQQAQGALHMERAIRLGASSAETHLFLGRAYERLGRLDEALVQFKLTATADPGRAEAYYEQALLMLERDAAQATQLFERALGLYEFYAGACSNLARLYRKAGRHEESQHMLERHREIALLSDLGVLSDPFSSKRFVAEYGFYGRQNKHGRALEVLAHGLERHPTSRHLWMLRGQCLAKTGEVDGARVAFEQAWKQKPGDPQAAMSLLDLYLRPDAPSMPAELRAQLDRAAQDWPQIGTRLVELGPQ